MAFATASLLCSGIGRDSFTAQSDDIFSIPEYRKKECTTSVHSEKEHGSSNECEVNQGDKRRNDANNKEVQDEDSDAKIEDKDLLRDNEIDQDESFSKATERENFQTPQNPSEIKACSPVRTTLFEGVGESSGAESDSGKNSRRSESPKGDIHNENLDTVQVKHWYQDTYKNKRLPDELSSLSDLNIQSDGSVWDINNRAREDGTGASESEADNKRPNSFVNASANVDSKETQQKELVDASAENAASPVPLPESRIPADETRSSTMLTDLVSESRTEETERKEPVNEGDQQIMSPPRPLTLNEEDGGSANNPGAASEPRREDIERKEPVNDVAPESAKEGTERTEPVNDDVSEDKIEGTGGKEPLESGASYHAIHPPNEQTTATGIENKGKDCFDCAADYDGDESTAYESDYSLRKCTSEEVGLDSRNVGARYSKRTVHSAKIKQPKKSNRKERSKSGHECTSRVGGIEAKMDLYYGCVRRDMKIMNSGTAKKFKKMHAVIATLKQNQEQAATKDDLKQMFSLQTDRKPKTVENVVQTESRMYINQIVQTKLQQTDSEIQATPDAHDISTHISPEDPIIGNRPVHVDEEVQVEVASKESGIQVGSETSSESTQTEKTNVVKQCQIGKQAGEAVDGCMKKCHGGIQTEEPDDGCMKQCQIGTQTEETDDGCMKQHHIGTQTEETDGRCMKKYHIGTQTEETDDGCMKQYQIGTQTKETDDECMKKCHGRTQTEEPDNGCMKKCHGGTETEETDDGSMKKYQIGTQTEKPDDRCIKQCHGGIQTEEKDDGSMKQCRNGIHKLEIDDENKIKAVEAWRKKCDEEANKRKVAEEERDLTTKKNKELEKALMAFCSGIYLPPDQDQQRLANLWHQMYFQ